MFAWTDRVYAVGARRSRMKCPMLKLFFIALAIQKYEAMPLKTVTPSTSTESVGFPFNRMEHVSPVIGEREKTVKRQTRATRDADFGDKIFFPVDEDSSELIFTPEPAPECKKSTFCEKIAFYPAAYISRTLEESKALESLVRGVDLVLPQPEEFGLKMDMSDDDATPLCRSVEQVVFPRTAQNKNHEWLFVLNQGNFKQGVRIETCWSPDGECSVVSGFAEGYTTTCKQKYIYRQLAAISRNGTTINDTFKLPSSCCCQLKLSDPFGMFGRRRYGRTPVSKLKRNSKKNNK